jgi:hypothetical protein
MSKDQNLSNLQIEKMTKQVEADYKNPNAVFGNEEIPDTNDSDSSDDLDDEINESERLKKLQNKLEERRKKLQRQKINIGSITLTSAKDKATSGGNDSTATSAEPKTAKNVVFNVRSLRAL